MNFFLGQKPRCEENVTLMCITAAVSRFEGATLVRLRKKYHQHAEQNWDKCVV